MTPATLFVLRGPLLLALLGAVSVIAWLAREVDSRPWSRFGSRGRRLERVSIAVAALPVLAACALAYGGASAELTQADQQLREGRLLLLESPDSIERVTVALGAIEPPSERRVLAEHVFQWLRSPRRGTLPNVGALSTVTVDIATVQSLSAAPALQKRVADLLERRTDQSSVPLFTSAQIREAKPGMVVRTPDEFRADFVTWALLLVFAFGGVHLAWSWREFHGDELMLAPLTVLCGLGFVVMTGLRDPLRDTELFKSFAQGVILGCVVLLTISLPWMADALAGLTFVPLLVSLALSVALIVFGTGPGSSDAKVNLGPVQPAEAMRVCLVLFMAGYFGKRWQFLRELEERRPRFAWLNRVVSIPKLDHLVPVLACLVLSLGLFYLQKDLGPALLTACLFLAMYAVARGRAALASCALLAIVGTMALSAWAGFPRTVATRVEMFLSPWDTPASGGDQLASSLWALASGGVLGAGIGLGEPARVPAAHTDMVVAAIGEQFGLAGTTAVFVCWATLLYRSRRIAGCSTTSYQFFLACACGLATAFQIALISGGVLGLAPLSGVVSPFLSYGRSSMVSNFAIVGLLASVSGRTLSPAEVVVRSRRGLTVVSRIVMALLVALAVRAAFVQVWAADAIAAAGVAVTQADGVRRLQYNPRLLSVANSLGRGSILDRTGVPVASSDWTEIAAHRSDFERLGVDVSTTPPASGRYYPFGPAFFHLLGDIRTHHNWGATNTAYVERDFESRLRGFDATGPDERQGRGAGQSLAGYHDYRPLVPLLRHQYDLGWPAVRRIREADRTVRMTIDAALTMRVADVLRRQLPKPGVRAAAVVIDVDSGGVLAAVNAPEPDQALPTGGEDAAEGGLFDRARFGLYPPGSVFKLVTAIAAMRQDHDSPSRVFVCRRLPDGRVGAVVRGWTVRDDVTDAHEHGALDMSSALARSCNAYFAQMAVEVGPAALFDTASRLGIRVAVPNTVGSLDRMLPQAGYGQGEVVVSPMQIAALAAAIAGDCRIRPVHVIESPRSATTGGDELVDRAGCRTLERAMRETVTEGTGTAALHASVSIAGKTGTAELNGARSHAWFAGFAPSDSSASHRIAFAVFVENGGYGGSVAAPIAADIVNEAASLGMFR